MQSKVLLALATAALSASTAHAETNADEFVFSGLTEADYNQGTRQYIVYFKDKGSDAAKWLSLWTRTTNIIERDGETLVEIEQVWRSDDARFQRELYSLNRADDFSPVFHLTKHGAEGVISAFSFHRNEIIGAPETENNSKADFQIASAPNTLNWELDMETFALLPLSKGEVFNINFYHPGSATAPKAYAYEVIGEDVLTGISGEDIETWMLKINYSESDKAIFWLDKRTGEMLKMEEVFGEMLRYKVRLGVLGDAPELTLQKQ